MNDLYRLIWLSRPLMQRAEMLVERHLDGTGLSVRMRAVLEILQDTEGLPVPELARRLEIQRQYVQVMVNEVIAAGYAAKAPNPGHRRSSLIVLTERGRNLIEGVMAREQAVVEALAAGFDAAEVAVARGVVERLVAAMQAKLGEDAE